MIDLDDGTVAALRAHRARQAAERLALGPAYQDVGLVFCHEDGAPIHPEQVRRMFRRHVVAAAPYGRLSIGRPLLRPRPFSVERQLQSTA